MPNLLKNSKTAKLLTNIIRKTSNQIGRIGTKKLRAIGALLIASLIILLIAHSTRIVTTESNTRDYYEVMTAQEVENAYTRHTIGMFIQKISAFDPQTKTFAADGYVWLKWKKPIKAWDKATQDDPALTLEFINAVEHWDFVKNLSPEEPYLDKDGWTYQALVFSGRFLASDLNLQRFPFESITLPIEIETDDFWLSELALIPDESGSSGISQKNALQGYTLNKATFTARKHIYETSMGLNADAREEFGRDNVGIYPNFLAEISYTRNFGSSSWQLLLPLGIVSSVAFLTPMIDARAAEAKIALPASVILTLVFLQDGYKQMLPQSLAYLTLFDKFYIAMYLSSLAIFGITIWYANKISRASDDQKHDTARIIRSQESTANFVVVLFLFVSLLLIWMTT